MLAADGIHHKVDLAGIDACARNHPYGRESTEYLQRCVGGRVVTVEYSKRDRYQRLVGKPLGGHANGLHRKPFSISGLVGGFDWQVIYDDVNADLSVAFFAQNASVPEAPTQPLMLLGLAGLVVARRRRVH